MHRFQLEYRKLARSAIQLPNHSRHWKSPRLLQHVLTRALSEAQPLNPSVFHHCAKMTTHILVIFLECDNAWHFHYHERPAEALRRDFHTGKTGLFHLFFEGMTECESLSVQPSCRSLKAQDTATLSGILFHESNLKRSAFCLNQVVKKVNVHLWQGEEKKKKDKPLQTVSFHRLLASLIHLWVHCFDVNRKDVKCVPTRWCLAAVQLGF